ncbi:MAG: cobalamin-binding protein [Herminiimonas sp.]|nr:cobalamin-binding protein [Herminiimonas sp.]
MARFLHFATAVIVLLASSTEVLAAVSVKDDAQRTVTLATPAQRIVSLAPHATELLFAAGAGDKVVGVSEYSNFPPQAQKINSVGGATSLDLERVIALKPDLVVIWGSGNSAAQLARLKTLDIPIFDSEPQDFETIASSLERLAHLAGTDAIGRAAAQAFRQRLQVLKATYSQRPPISVFYQIWRAPLMTLNDRHMVSTAIKLCGGVNVFGKLPQLAPTISIEAVLQADPETIITGSSAKAERLDEWRRFTKLTAVRRANLISLDSDTMTRAGPRILDGTDALCRQLDAARARR